MSKAEYIDTIIGTVGDEQGEHCHGGGKTYPGACLPGGMVQLSPDTVTGGDNGTGYNFCHNTIEGFSFNRMSGIGWYGDLGNVQIMPVIGDTDLRSGTNREIPFLKGTEGWKSEFSHDTEKTEAGYYSVFLERYKINAEATVTTRTGMLRFTYPETDDGRIIFNFSRRIGGKADFQKIDIIDDTHIEGYIKCTPAGGGFGHGDGKITYNLHFSMEMSVAPEKFRFFSNEELVKGDIRSFENEDVGLIAFFGEVKEPVIIKCGISYVDVDGARKNLCEENKSFDFDAVRKEALDCWEYALRGVDVSGSDETDLKIFCTCLYHVLLDPRTAMDVDGRFAIDTRVFKGENYIHRTVFSGWDVYRSEFPLLAIINPDMVKDEVSSLLKIAEINNSSLPRWEVLGINAGCMVGDPGAIVLCDAADKDILPYDIEKAYEIMKATALCEKELFGEKFTSIRPECKQFLEDCYVPEKLSDTLEYLLADFTIAKLAKKLGKTEDEEFFMARAKRYGENFCKYRGFMSPRKAKGSFMFEKSKYDDEGCVESNIFQQSWFVPYDVEGLSRLFGKKRMIRLLEKFFKKADFSALWNDDYNHSNEPCHNITHYFNMLGLPHRTQYWTRRVQKEAYRTGAFGFCGNEDVGQLSAWYVLSALGFAQLCPGHQAYFINTPLFRTAKIRLSPEYHNCKNSEYLSIVCDKDPLENVYIKSVKFNGKELKVPYLTYEEITSGGTVEFELSEKPCEIFGEYVSTAF